MISLITFASSACSNSFFGLPNWWKFLPNQPTPPECNVNITFPNPEHAASARRRLVNSLLGLLIALVATGFVTFVGNSLKG
jgi:hypothetical protein